MKQGIASWINWDMSKRDPFTRSLLSGWVKNTPKDLINDFIKSSHSRMPHSHIRFLFCTTKCNRNELGRKPFLLNNNRIRLNKRLAVAMVHCLLAVKFDGIITLIKIERVVLPLHYAHDAIKHMSDMDPDGLTSLRMKSTRHSGNTTYFFARFWLGNSGSSTISLYNFWKSMNAKWLDNFLKMCRGSLLLPTYCSL